MKQIKSFTLAEVLITLVVIGIIAAITVPLIMTNYRKTETAARLKKFYSTMSNAIRLSEIQYGMPSEEFESSSDTDYLEKYILSNINYIQVENGYKVYLDDGTIMEIGCGPVFCLYFDTNGDRKPNEFGRDIFAFEIYQNYTGAEPKEKNVTFTPEYPQCYYNNNCTRDLIKTECQNEKYACTYLLQLDGWEIKSDYPLKI